MPALWVIEEDGSEQKLSFAELSERSSRVAGWLRAQGVARGERMIVMLGNQVELRETLLATASSAAMPVTSSSGAPMRRSSPRCLAAYTRIAVGGPVEGWLRYGDAYDGPAGFVPDGITHASDPLLRPARARRPAAGADRR